MPQADWLLYRRDTSLVVYESRLQNANFTSAPSPDGKAVALIDGASLIIVEVGRTGREILSLKSGEQFHPFPGSLEWTADGRSVLFAKVVGRNREGWRVSARGGHPEPIGLWVRDQALYFLRNSTDGRYLAFVLGDCDLRPREVWVMKHLVSERPIP